MAWSDQGRINRETHIQLQRKIVTINFILDLRFMNGALREIYTDLCRVNKKNQKLLYKFSRKKNST